ncbi:c-type cytochrome [Marinicellulosiphila megalodicopiae]|uniref:c-type cytochrome n=1 Tax=Marinicellulosiphila megalodicopiae TaxID=2724896 RepID=UPI003BAEF119
MKHVISFLAISSMLVFLSCSPEYEGNVGGASDPNYCKAPISVQDTSEARDMLFDLPDTVSSVDYSVGCKTYVEKCANCHMLDGMALNKSLALGDATAIHESAGYDTLCESCEIGKNLGPRIAIDMPPKRGDSVPLSLTEAEKVSVYIRAKFYNDITPSNDEIPANLPESMRPDESIVNVRGRELYNDNNCAACHGSNGRSGIYGKPMTEYTIDKVTLIGKLDGTKLNTIAGYGSPDDIMNEGGSPADNDDIAEYMNEAFDYGW